MDDDEANDGYESHAENIPAPPYEVGYKKPPEHSRFKKGKSGNPQGRPKGSKGKLRGNERALSRYILSEAGRRIIVQDGGKEVSMTMAQAIFRTVSVKAVKGNLSAAKLLLNMVNQADSEESERIKEDIQLALEYKNLTYRQLKYRKELGRKFTFPLPHPDHVKIDWETGEVSVRGPVDKDTLKPFLILIDAIVQQELSLEMLNHELSDLKSSDYPEGRDIILEEINSEVCILKKYRELIPKTDPLWIEYSPAIRLAWVDYYYYYAEAPNSDGEINFSDLIEIKHFAQENLNLDPDLIMNYNFKESFLADFHGFMRSYLAWSMQEAWQKRLKRKHHILRNIETDKNLYEITMKYLEQEEGVSEEDIFIFFQTLEIELKNLK